MHRGDEVAVHECYAIAQLSVVQMMARPLIH